MVRVPVCSDVGGLWQYVTTDALPALNFFRLLLLNKISCLRGFSNHNNLLYPRQYVRLSNLKWICMLYLSSSSTETVFPPFLHKGSVMFQGCDKSVRCFLNTTGKAPDEEFDFSSWLLSWTCTHTHTHFHPLKLSRDAKYVTAPLPHYSQHPSHSEQSLGINRGTLDGWKRERGEWAGLRGEKNGRFARRINV